MWVSSFSSRLAIALIAASCLLSVVAFERVQPTCVRRSSVFMSASKFNSKDVAVVIPPSYNVPAGFIAASAGITFGLDNPWIGVPIGVIGALLAVQAGRVRFLFDKDALEIKFSKKGTEEDEQLVNSGQNFAVGGKNRWKYSTFTDWFFIPSKDFPILMYFNEIQTNPKGQLHLFPVIMDGKILYETLMEKVGSNPAAKVQK